MVGYILARIVLEGSVGNGEVRVFGVVSTKSVVMFGGEYHVFDTCILHYICPLFGIEVYRIERVFQAPVPLFVFIVWQRFLREIQSTSSEQMDHDSTMPGTE